MKDNNLISREKELHLQNIRQRTNIHYEKNHN